MKLWTIVSFEIRRLMSNWGIIINLFLLPMLLIFILGNALSGVVGTNGDAPVVKIVVGVVNQGGESGEDPGLTAFLGSPEIGKSLEVRTVASRDKAEDMLRSGEIDYAVMIPEGFEERIASGDPAQWEYLLGKDHLVNLTAGAIFDAYLDGINRMQSTALVLGPEKVIPALADAEKAADVYVQDTSLSENGDHYSSFQYYAASMLIMFLLYSGIMVSESLNTEIKGRTLYRLGSMPVSPLTVFVGKIFGNSIITLAQAATIIYGTSWLYGVNWGAHPAYLLAICVLVVLCSMMLAVVCTLLTKSQTAAKAVVQVVIITMTFLSGGFNPLPVDLIQKLGEFTVNHWALQGILRVMLDADAGEIMRHVLMLGIAGGLLLLIGIITYRKAGYHYE